MSEERLEPVHAASGLSEPIQKVLSDLGSRRARGEVVSDAEVIAEHRDLLPDLARALEAAKSIRQARLEARKAGSISGELEALTDDELMAPLGVPSEDGSEGPYAEIDGYTIIGEIERGGQAVVFKAIQEATGRKMAIKILPGGAFTSSRHRVRFDREAAILANLDHPNIVSIIDRGRTADGSFFMVMPFIQGYDLDEYLVHCRQEDPDGVARVLRVFEKIADALGQAHAKEVVHRDLKPSNIRVDDRGEPHVLDFGLARPLRNAVGQNWRVYTITEQGQVIGSIPWASPEQAAGQDLDVRSDVYSLGVMLYEAIAGALPYSVVGPLRHVLDNIQRTTPVPPSRRSRWRRSKLDAAADGVVLKALAKSPNDRYASAVELAADLGNCLAGRPTRAVLRDTRRRLRAGVLLTFFLTAILVSGGWYTFSKWQSTTVFELPQHVNTLGMKFVRIPDGAYLIGSPPGEEGHDRSERLREVPNLGGFYISVTEITRKQYRDIMSERSEGSAVHDENLPASDVSWEEAVAFCERLGRREGCTYRLPTESEWECACRAGTKGTFAGSGHLDQMGWFSANAGGRPHEVARKTPNQWGLYDMHGNVAEWCSDPYPGGAVSDDSPSSTSPNGNTRRVVRGGSFEQDRTACRSAHREGWAQQAKLHQVGFRIVWVKPPPSP